MSLLYNVCLIKDIFKRKTSFKKCKERNREEKERNEKVLKNQFPIFLTVVTSAFIFYPVSKVTT